MDENTNANRPAPGTVLIVDDEPELVSLFAATLESRHTVHTATSGDEALAAVSDDVDVVLLDRMMPGQSGDEVLAEIRDRGLACRVAMVTAVQPDVDLVSVDFDAYVVKPMHPSELHDLVDRLLRRGEFTEQVDELLAIAEKRAAIEAGVDENTLESDEGYQELLATHDRLRAENQALAADLDATVDSAVLYADVLGQPPDD
jgi:DNA-binding response OmpR family regulator